MGFNEAIMTQNSKTINNMGANGWVNILRLVFSNSWPVPSPVCVIAYRLNSGYLLKSFLLYLYAVSFLAKKFHYFIEDLDKKNHLKIERRIYYVNPISMRHFFCIAIRQGPLSNWTEHSILPYPLYGGQISA